MKKLSILSALLLSAAVIFMGCKTPVDPEDDDKVDQTVERVTLSDGDWTVKAPIRITQSSNSVDMVWTVKFSSSNNVGTAKSGTISMSMKTSEVLGSNYAAYTAMTPAQKEAFNNQYKEILGQMYSSLGTVTSATIDDNDIKVELAMSENQLTAFNQQINFNSTYPAGTVIKTNKKKTKYEITVPQSQGTTVTYTVTKD